MGKDYSSRLLIAQLIKGILDGGWYPEVIDFHDPSLGLPINPAIGDRYIASVASANGWLQGNIYEWSGFTWFETPTKIGNQCYVTNLTETYLKTSAIAWNTQESTVDHLTIQNIGVNSHAQIDTHIANAEIHLPFNSHYAENLSVQSTTSNVFQLAITTGFLPAYSKYYYFDFQAEMTGSVAGNIIETQLVVVGAEQIICHISPATPNQYCVRSGFCRILLTTGLGYIINVNFRKAGGGGTSYIRRIRLRVWEAQ